MATGANTGIRYLRASSDTIPPGDAQPCPGTPTVTDIDGNVYNTVKIGEQCWMKENLRVTRYADGTPIYSGGDATSNTVPYYYVNPNLDAAVYGYFYNWPAAVGWTAALGYNHTSNTNQSNVQGACPTGWHVPSIMEWEQLSNYVSSVPAYVCGNSTGQIGMSLASQTGWNSNGISCVVGYYTSHNNATGFSTVPAGYCNGSSFSSAGSSAFLWSSTEYSTDYAWYSFLVYSASGFNTNYYEKIHGRSIRCLLNPPCSPSSSEFSDTICDGNDGYTWNDSVYTESGDYTQTFTNAAGCDSVVTLHLTITDCTPPCDAFAVRILGDTAECATDSVTLYAMVPGATPPVAVGDILCTDNTIVKPGDWPVAGKTALGVVFHVDGTGLHGWAVHLNDQSTSITWGGSDTDIPNLHDFEIAREALADTAGFANTLAIRALGDASTYPAAWAVDLDNGWYLPAAGQLRVLFGELPTLNASLQTVGGTQFPMSGYWCYWSSTERSSSYAWALYYLSNLDCFSKAATIRVHSVRAF